MGRPTRCDRMDVRKGPWTLEEDITLVSYIQQHAPGNWRSVPTNTGLLRCSKSCRLRWTNYLRLGIKRGNFTDHEDKMIIHLQALIGNRWAAIASYLPQRTDNDIKNYWNTHLKKKLKKLKLISPNEVQEPLASSSSSPSNQNPNCSNNSSCSCSKGQWERTLQKDIHMAKQALSEALFIDQKITTMISTTQSAIYVSSAANIARLLQGWSKNLPNTSGLVPKSSDPLYPTGSQFNSDELKKSSKTTESSSRMVHESRTMKSGKGVCELSLLEKWLFDDNIEGSGCVSASPDLADTPMDEVNFIATDTFYN